MASSSFKKRVSFNNLYNEIIDPENPRFSPKFITEDEEQIKAKPEVKDLDFGFSVRRSSKVSSSDPAKFFKFNDFNFINSNDREYHDLQNQKEWTEDVLKKQKLKREKLPTISKDKSILKVKASSGLPSESNTGNLYNNQYNPNSTNSTNIRKVSNGKPDSFSQVYNRFKTEDQDELTFQNTQRNILMNPNLSQKGLQFVKNSQVDDGEKQIKEPSRRKRLVEMTDEEILKLDGQFSSTRSSIEKNDILNDLETTIEFSKFKTLSNNLTQSHTSGDSAVPTAKYSKEGINLTNFFSKTYPTRPVIKYKSLILQCQHKEFDQLLTENNDLTYPPKSEIQKLLSSNKHISMLGDYCLINNESEVDDLDPAVTLNKTVLSYISGRNHSWSSLKFLLSKDSNVLKNGDTLVVFTLIPSDFDVLEDILELFKAETQPNNNEDSNGLVRYKTTSMLDDLNNYQLKKLKSASSTITPSSNPKGNGASPKDGFIVPKNPSSGFEKKARSGSLIDDELKKMNSVMASLSTGSKNVIRKRPPLTQHERHRKVIEKIHERGENLLKALETLALDNDLKIKITLEICFNKSKEEIKNEELDPNELRDVDIDQGEHYSGYSPYNEVLDSKLGQKFGNISLQPKKKVQLNLKYIFRNIMEVYTPDLIVIGTKYNHGFHTLSSNSTSVSLVNSDTNTTNSTSVSISNSRRSSIGDFNDFNRPEIKKSMSNTSSILLDEDFGEAGNKIITFSNSPSTNGIGATKNLRIPDFLRKNTNIPLLVVPNYGLLSQLGMTSSTEHINSNWLLHWENSFIHDGGFDEDDDELDDIEDDIILKSSTDSVNIKDDTDVLVNELQKKVTSDKVLAPESFFIGLIVEPSDKSLSESLNYLKNSSFNSHDLPPTSRNRQLLINKLNQQLKMKTKNKRKGKSSNFSDIKEDAVIIDDSDSDSDSSSDDDFDDRPYVPKHVDKYFKIHDSDTTAQSYETPSSVPSVGPKITFAPTDSNLAKAKSQSSDKKGLAYKDILSKTKSNTSVISQNSQSSGNKPKKKGGLFKKFFKK